jgi:hypothetical protein
MRSRTPDSCPSFVAADMPTLKSSLGAALLAALALAPAGHAAPTFTNYPGPAALAGDAGEPSIGYNPGSGATLFQSYLTTLKVTGFDGAGGATWQDVTEPTAITSLDPILWTDRDTGRTISSQLLLACSKAAITDDDGASWLPSQGCGIGTVLDHQSIGGGPFAGLLRGADPVYPNAVYYCTQDGILAAHCATSLDGGTTFGPEREIYNALQCPLLLHGHVKVAPDGTAYVPTADCDGKQSLAETTDNGLTWSVEEVPQTTTQDESDPHLGIGDKGTLYLGWQGGDGTDLGDKGYVGHARSEGRPWISVKPAGSSAWRPPVDVGAALGIKNIQFPEVYAGDDDRAAYAFLGTTTAGDDQAADFKGTWHLYVAHTYDGGLNWTTVDATPTDPVQRGCIWLQGGSSSCRNLLDFNDITIDSDGRVLVAYADGCTDACVSADPASYDYGKDRTDLGVIARQESGLGLLSASDSVLAPAAAVPARTFSRHAGAPRAEREGDEEQARESAAGR